MATTPLDGLNAEQINDEIHLAALEARITEEIEAAIGEHSDLPDSPLAEIQPPTSIVHAAAVAAAQAIMAFERGYRMNIDDDEEQDKPT